MGNTKKKLVVEEESLEGFVSELEERECAVNTIRKYSSNVRMFYHFLGEERTIDKGTVLKYKDWLINRYEATSVNSMLVALNQYLTYMDARELKVKRMKMQKRQFANADKKMNKEEYQHLVQIAREQKKYRLELAIQTICASGIRVSELKYLTVEHVKKGRIQVFNKGKLRVILLPNALQDKLLNYVKTENIKKGEIFITRTGKSLDRSNLWSEMKALAVRANIEPEKVFPHNLRHLFAETYYDETQDLFGLADLLGHSSLEITRLYATTSEEVYQKRIEELEFIQ